MSSGGRGPGACEPRESDGPPPGDGAARKIKIKKRKHSEDAGPSERPPAPEPVTRQAPGGAVAAATVARAKQRFRIKSSKDGVKDNRGVERERPTANGGAGGVRTQRGTPAVSLTSDADTARVHTAPPSVPRNDAASPQSASPAPKRIKVSRPSSAAPPAAPRPTDTGPKLKRVLPPPRPSDAPNLLTPRPTPPAPPAQPLPSIAPTSAHAPLPTAPRNKIKLKRPARPLPQVRTAPLPQPTLPVAAPLPTQAAPAGRKLISSSAQLKKTIRIRPTGGASLAAHHPHMPWATSAALPLAARTKVPGLTASPLPTTRKPLVIRASQPGGAGPATPIPKAPRTVLAGKDGEVRSAKGAAPRPLRIKPSVLPSPMPAVPTRPATRVGRAASVMPSIPGRIAVASPPPPPAYDDSSAQQELPHKKVRLAPRTDKAAVVGLPAAKSSNQLPAVTVGKRAPMGVSPGKQVDAAQPADAAAPSALEVEAGRAAEAFTAAITTVLAAEDEVPQRLLQSVLLKVMRKDRQGWFRFLPGDPRARLPSSTVAAYKRAIKLPMAFQPLKDLVAGTHTLPQLKDWKQMRLGVELMKANCELFNGPDSDLSVLIRRILNEFDPVKEAEIAAEAARGAAEAPAEELPLRPRHEVLPKRNAAMAALDSAREHAPMEAAPRRGRGRGRNQAGLNRATLLRMQTMSATRKPQTVANARNTYHKQLADGQVWGALLTGMSAETGRSWAQERPRVGHAYPKKYVPLQACALKAAYHVHSALGAMRDALLERAAKAVVCARQRVTGPPPADAGGASQGGAEGAKDSAAGAARAAAPVEAGSAGAAVGVRDAQDGGRGVDANDAALQARARGVANGAATAYAAAGVQGGGQAVQARPVQQSPLQRVQGAGGQAVQAGGQRSMPYMMSGQAAQYAPASGAVSVAAESMSMPAQAPLTQQQVHQQAAHPQVQQRAYTAVQQQGAAQQQAQRAAQASAGYAAPQQALPVMYGSYVAAGYTQQQQQPAAPAQQGGAPTGYTSPRQTTATATGSLQQQQQPAVAQYGAQKPLLAGGGPYVQQNGGPAYAHQPKAGNTAASVAQQQAAAGAVMYSQPPPPGSSAYTPQQQQQQQSLHTSYTQQQPQATAATHMQQSAGGYAQQQQQAPVRHSQPLHTQPMAAAAQSSQPPPAQMPTAAYAQPQPQLHPATYAQQQSAQQQQHAAAAAAYHAAAQPAAHQQAAKPLPNAYATTQPGVQAARGVHAAAAGQMPTLGPGLQPAAGGGWGQPSSAAAAGGHGHGSGNAAPLGSSLSHAGAPGGDGAAAWGAGVVQDMHGVVQDMHGVSHAGQSAPMLQGAGPTPTPGQHMAAQNSCAVGPGTSLSGTTPMQPG